MAGTTVEDGGTVESAFTRAVDGMGLADLDAALTYVRDTMGQSKIVVFRALFDGDEAKAAEANRRFESAYDDAVRADGAQPIAGAEQTIAAMRDAGVRICLTTGFSPATRDLLIDALGWRSLVDLALSPADAGRGRPYPDMILAAVLRLEIDDVREVAVAGDTASDLLAGSRAGAGIVAGVLTGAHDREALEAAPHTHILDNITALPAIVLRR
jgi:phosphonatase-like hydrolase